MSRRAIALAALAAAIVTTPAAAHAQSPLRFGLAAGATIPTGDAADIAEWGYHVSGSITGKPMLSPVGIRGEVMWNRLTGKDVEVVPGVTESGDDLDILAGIVNAEIGMSGIGVKPYFIGGLGMYRLSSEGADSETKFGFNLGAGLDFGLAGFSAFAEARFHSIQADDFGNGSVNLVPLTFGIRF
jgi:hypothetical protein